MSTDFGGLVPYYTEFVPEHLPKINGKPRSRRSAQKIAVQYGLPVIRVGHNAFIDPELAAEVLREAQLIDRKPRGRGRPAGKAAPADTDHPMRPGRIR
jgi:hypothetical protein